MIDETDMMKVFDAALEKWDSNNERTVDSRAAQFFFFAGAQYGIAATKKIHEEIYGEPV